MSSIRRWRLDAFDSAEGFAALVRDLARTGLVEEAVALVNGAAQQWPDATVRIFRSAPSSSGGRFNRGDWVTLARSYAADHGRSEGWPVYAVDVPAHTVRFAGDDLMEWGYCGQRVTGEEV